MPGIRAVSTAAVKVCTASLIFGAINGSNSTITVRSPQALTSGVGLNMLAVYFFCLIISALFAPIVAKKPHIPLNPDLPSMTAGYGGNAVFGLPAALSITT